MTYFVYILTNAKRTVFYIGVINNLKRRAYEHKNGLIDGFSKKYSLKYIVYFEEFKNIEEAIAREKQLKNWKRQWKINLIENKNPTMNDLTINW